MDRINALYVHMEGKEPLSSFLHPFLLFVRMAEMWFDEPNILGRDGCSNQVVGVASHVFLQSF
jgi:hypothetical protein